MFKLPGMKPQAVSSVIEDRIYEAQREYLDHAAAAARYQALADMYQARVAWLKHQREILDAGDEPEGDLPNIKRSRLSRAG